MFVSVWGLAPNRTFKICHGAEVFASYEIPKTEVDWSLPPPIQYASDTYCDPFFYCYALKVSFDILSLRIYIHSAGGEEKNWWEMLAFMGHHDKPFASLLSSKWDFKGRVDAAHKNLVSWLSQNNFPGKESPLLSSSLLRFFSYRINLWPVMHC